MSKFHEVAKETADLVETKDKAYGSAFSKAGEYLKLLYPNGIKPEQYGDMLTLIRMFDKSVRIATDKDALGEDPFRDIMGYAILAVAQRKNCDGSGGCMGECKDDHTRV